MDWSGKGKYLASIITIVVFLGSEYTFLHHQKTAEALGSSPTIVNVPNTTSQSENGRTFTTGVLIRSDSAASNSSRTLPDELPTPTQIVAKIHPSTPPLNPSVSPAYISPTPTPPVDCILHGNTGCEVIEQTVGKVKQTTTTLTKPLRL